MSQDSLFVSLRSYSPRPDRDPLENFLTEAFAWILRQHPSLSERLLSVVHQEAQLLEMDLPEEVHWETQVNLENGFADMVATAGDRTYVFEHKTRSKATAKQVDRYRNEIGSAEVVTVLITGAPSNYSGPNEEGVRPPNARMTWEEVYKVVDDWCSSSTKDTERVEDFLALLDHEGLGPQEPLSETMLRAFAAGKDVTDHLYRLSEILRESCDWSFVYEAFRDPEGQDHPTFRWNEEKRSPLWGRIGLRLYSNWTPGLFAGFLVDPENHEAKLVAPEMGPDLTVILDVGSSKVGGREGFREFATTDAYRNLCERLEDLKGWKVDARDVNEALEKNQSHPILIQRPLARLLRGSTATEKQIETIYSSLREGIRHFVEGDEMEKLREQIRKQ